MKKIVKFSKIQPQGVVVVDNYNPDYQQMEIAEFCDLFIPYTKLFNKIVLKNFVSIPAELINRLISQYLHGAQIEICTPSRQFDKTYTLHNPKAFYNYFWTELDLTKPIPKSLANFELVFNGHKTTYLNAISTLKTTKYLPHDIWTALDTYSKQQIDKCREYNRGEYSLAELWFKELMKDCMQSNIKVYSPNQKTYYEALAEIDFDKQISECRLPKGLRPLSDDEIAFLKTYAPAYGVTVPQFEWKINSRKTKDGYTEEPERVVGGMSTQDWIKCTYDYRNKDNLPGFVRKNLVVKSCDNDKLLRDAYFNLIWIIKNLGDEGLMPNWKRCPKCHKLYREHDGCECGYCKPMIQVDADNLFYGISSTYEDYESTAEAYDDLPDDYETFDD